MLTKKLVLVIVGLVVLGLLVAGYLYFIKPKSSVVNTAAKISEQVPEIQTNPGQKVPEVNPLDRANPFKYKNPLK